MGFSHEAMQRAVSVARDRAGESEAGRRLAPEVVASLEDAGLFTLCLPAAYGGPGIEMVEVLDAVAAVAHADASAGWCAGIASTTSSLAAYLEPAVARKVYPSPATATGGVFAPNGRGAVSGDEVTVTGRWQWGSGTQHCAWIVGGVMCDDDTQRVVFFEHDQIAFHVTWNAAGLRGTGSLDFAVTDVEVPLDHTFVVGTPPAIDDTIARFPNFTLLSLGIAATAIGNARRALDEVRELASAKTPQFSSRPLNQSAYAQYEFARAEARWRAARTLLHAEVGSAWALACAGSAVGVDVRVAMRLAAAHAASECVAVAQSAWELAGGTAVYDTSVLGRCLRDAHVVTQHIMVAPKLHETLGRRLLGAEFDGRMI